MSWPGNWSGNYMPLGFASARPDGTVERLNEPPNDYGFPLMDHGNPNDPSFAQSPPRSSGQWQSAPSNFETPHRPVSDRSSSSATLLGGDYYQSPRPESFQTAYSYSKYSDTRSGAEQNRQQKPRKHKPWKQFLHLLGTGFARFLMTAALIVALWQVLWIYNKIAVLNTTNKRVFNFLVTAISLALGLNLASSLKSVSVKARWWILSWEKRPLDEVEAILSCHALTEVIKLGCKSVFKKPSVTMACVLWLFVNLAVQAFVAALGLNFSLESAVDSKSAVAGSVIYKNLTQFYFKQGWDSISADQITAHLYGDLAMNYNINKSSDVPDRLPIIPPLALYSASNYTNIWDFDTYSQYVFMDYPAQGDSSIGLFYSNRSITTEASCTSTPEEVVLQPNGTVAIGDFDISFQPNSTLYVVGNGTEESCGTRCAKVYVLENYGNDAFLYFCNVTVGDVMNASSIRWAQSLADELAVVAAQSIAVTGFGGRMASSTDQGYTYFHDDFWGTYQAGNNTAMEWILRIHAIGAIVGADKYNDPVPDPMPGLIPNQGVRLTLDHPDFIEAILGGIGGFHFILFIVAAWLANKVIVIDDSYLAIALLMRPVVDRLNYGSLMNDKQICKALKNPKVRYGTVERNTFTGKIKHLEISEMSGIPHDGWKGSYG